MKKLALAAAMLVFSPGAQAQDNSHIHAPGMHRNAPTHAASPNQPSQPGQSAFAAIQEIVAILEADPKTDWSKVDIEALRAHLIDMSNVTLNADVAAEPLQNGVRFLVSGTGRVRDSIRRMVLAHAATMSGKDGFAFGAAERPDGAALTITANDAADVAKIKALGFIGMMTRGMHHQVHHLMIATGAAPHK